MKIHTLLALTLICLNLHFGYAQTGLYKCNNYEWKSETEPSKNRIEIGGHCKEVFENLYARIHPTVGQFHAVKKKK